MITKPGNQTANVENAADAAAVLGTDYQTSNGMKYGTVMTDIRAVTQGKALVRSGSVVQSDLTVRDNLQPAFDLVDSERAGKERP